MSRADNEFSDPFNELNEAWEDFVNGIIKLFKIEEILKLLEKKLGRKCR